MTLPAALRPYVRIGTIAVAAISVLFVGYRISIDLQVVAAQNLRIDLLWGAISFVAILFALLMGGLTWIATEVASGISRGWRRALRVHYYSNLSKYVPGYAWQLASKSYMLGSNEIPPRRIAISLISEIASLLFSGAILILLFSNVLLAVLIILVFVLALLLVRHKLVIRPNWWLACVALAALGWFFYGFSFWALTKAFAPVTFEELTVYIPTFIAAILIGLAAIGVPGGIGVREGVILLLMGNSSPLIPFGIILIGLRILLVIAEVLGAAFVHLL